MKRNTKKIHIIITIVLMAALVLPAAAYFSADIVKSLGLGISANGDSITVNASTYDEFELFARDSTQIVRDGKGYTYTEFNGTGNVKSSVRRIIRLTGDIALKDHVVITADCHIDLAGHTLDLGGYSLTFRSGYHGSTDVKGGTIKFPASDVSPEIYKDTPNITALTFSGVTFKKGNADHSGPYYTDISESDVSLGYRALLLAADKIFDEATYYRDQLSYKELNALMQGSGSFAASVFRNAHICSYKGGVQFDTCTLVYKDLDLPKTLEYSEGVTIEYSSGNTAVLTSDGKLTPPAAMTDVTLTATVKRDGNVIASTAFPLHIINTGAAGQCNEGARFLFTSFMSKYYDSENSVYRFDRSVYIPNKFKLGSTSVNLDFSIKAGSSVETVGDPSLVPSGDVTIFTPSRTATEFTVTFGTGASAVSILYPISSGASRVIESNASIAKQFLKRVYGGNGDTIMVQALNNGSSFDPEPLVDIDELAQEKGAISVSYEKISDNDGIYEIVEIGGTKYIRVALGKDPATSIEPVIIECTFEFRGTDKKEKLLVEVIATSGEDSDNVSGFLPYYTYYDSQFQRLTAGSTTESFTMPFSFGIKAIVCYDLSANINGTWIENPTGTPITVSLFYNNTDHAITLPSGNSSYVDALEAHLAANKTQNRNNQNTLNYVRVPETISEIIACGDAMWQFTINKSSIPAVNMEYRIHYNYKISTNDEEWTRYRNDDEEVENPEDIVSEFIIPGILQLGRDVPDETLYRWMYTTYTGRTNYVSGTSVVNVDWLKQDAAFDMVTDAVLASVTNLKGIEFLSGTQYMRLKPQFINSSNASTSARSVMQYITGMTSLRELVLTDNDFYDRDSSGAAYNGMFDGIESLVNLTTLYMDENKIYSFEFLLKLPALEKVYINDNIVTETMGGGNAAVDSIFYGSSGLTNYTVYQQLQSNGVAVYNTAAISGSNTVYKLFENSSEINDYINLRSIEYQAKLAAGEDIRKLYQGFSTTPADYHLKTTYGTDLDVTEQSLVWGYISSNGQFLTDAGQSTTATQIAVQYSLKVGGQAVVLLITYDVARVTGGAR